MSCRWLRAQHLRRLTDSRWPRRSSCAVSSLWRPTTLCSGIESCEVPLAPRARFLRSRDNVHDSVPGLRVGFIVSEPDFWNKRPSLGGSSKQVFEDCFVCSNGALSRCFCLSCFLGGHQPWGWRHAYRRLAVRHGAPGGQLHLRYPSLWHARSGRLTADVQVGVRVSG